VGSTTIVLDLSVLSRPDAGTVELLALMQLGARRAGVELRLANASESLTELVELTGLGAVLRLEPQRQPEPGEQPCGVEEEGELGDPVG
jgi:anti-anti-sigma regulatory factor